MNRQRELAIDMPPDGTELDTPLGELAQRMLSESTRLEIVRRFWDFEVQNRSAKKLEQFDPYFMELKSTLNNILSTDPSAKLTLRNLIEMVDFLKDHVTMTYTDVIVQCPKVQNGVPCEKTIELCLKFWLLMDPIERDFQDIGTQDQPIWPGNMSLKQAIAAEFPSQTPRMDATRWPYILNASNLEHISRLEIVWTSNLRQHLVLREAEKTVRLFHHATVIEHLQKLDRRIKLFPTDFLLETRQSLAILLPKLNQSSQKWYQKSKKSAERMPDFIIDDRVHEQNVMISGRKTETYKHWGERMASIKEAFDASEPNTFHQWWSDTRNSANRSAFWYAFWGICLAAFFGFCQTAIGVYQVILVYRPPMNGG